MIQLNASTKPIMFMPCPTRLRQKRTRIFSQAGCRGKLWISMFLSGAQQERKNKHFRRVELHAAPALGNPFLPNSLAPHEFMSPKTWPELPAKAFPGQSLPGLCHAAAAGATDVSFTSAVGTSAGCRPPTSLAQPSRGSGRWLGGAIRRMKY